MADESSSHKGLIGVILVLIVILVVGFVLWQRDQESKDVNIEIGMEDGEAVVEPGPQLARGLPEGIGLSVA
jgi:preprotein translocase subunit SecG